MVADFEKQLDVENVGSAPYRHGMMVVLTAFFILLYTAGLLGWLRPLSDLTMITRLEPIIFVIIGYYFSRLSGHNNEKLLKDEAERQNKKAEAAQHVKEMAQIEREIVEEKLRNVKTVIANLTRDTNVYGNKNGGGRTMSGCYRGNNGPAEILKQILERR